MKSGGNGGGGGKVDCRRVCVNKGMGVVVVVYRGWVIWCRSGVETCDPDGVEKGKDKGVLCVIDVGIRTVVEKGGMIVAEIEVVVG
jgi:hypothetical protein